MIHHVEGRIAGWSPGRLVVDVGGVGFEIHVTASTGNDAGRVGDLCRLLTHASVREDGWTLYGFLEEQERTLFRLLLGVQGIGPKVALSILSSIPAARLARVVGDGDLASLTTLPGVGKKTASRILVDLKDKLAPYASDAVEGTGPGSAAVAVAADPAVDALGALGYPFASGRDAVRNSRAAHPESPVELVLKDALRRL